MSLEDDPLLLPMMVIVAYLFLRTLWFLWRLGVLLREQWAADLPKAWTIRRKR